MKSFFNTKSLRERVLILGFLVAGLVWWGSSALGRARQFSQEWSDINAELKTQREWLGRKDEVAERMAAVGRKLDPSRTLNAAQAFAEINRLTHSMSVEIGAQRTERSENFARHSLQFTNRKAGMDTLIPFYKELSARSPYLGIEQCSLSTDRAAPGQLNAVFRIYSVEVLGAK